MKFYYMLVAQLVFNRNFRNGYIYGRKGGFIEAAPSPFGYDQWCDWHEGYRCGK